MKLTRQDYILAGGQALLWITLWLIPPAIDFFIRFNPSSAFEVWKINTGFITPLAIVFTANFYVLVPYLLYRDRKMLFGLMNLLLITGANKGRAVPADDAEQPQPSDPPDGYQPGHRHEIGRASCRERV